MNQQAKGPFDVKLTPQKGDNPPAEKSGVGRMSIDKQYHGDLEASGLGEMLAIRCATTGSAGYVAMERVSGTLQGRRGSFVLQHNATMTRGTPYQNIVVVPDSGSGDLERISGTMTVVIAEGGQHSYVFDYTLDAPA